MERIRQLEADRAERRGHLKEILNTARKDKASTKDKDGKDVVTLGRALTAEESDKIDALTAELERIEATLKHEQLQAAWDREAAPAVDGDADPEPKPKAAVGKNPWRSLGEQLQAVAIAAIDGVVDPRLVPEAAASGLNTSVQSEAGYLVRTEFSTRLLERAREESQLLPLCTRIPIGEGADGIELPYIDESSRANGSRWGGVQVYRRAEADTVAASKPKFGRLEIRLEDMMGICYSTDRAVRDAVSLGAIIELAFASEFGFKADDEIIRGTGVGQCLGILNSGALVTQAAEGSQVADTVVAENVIKMRSRLRPRSRPRSRWIINQEVEPQLPLMVVKVKNVAGSENVGGAPIYMPASGLSEDGYDRLFARPIMPIEQASAVGDVGDIMLVDFGEYLVIEKGGIESAESIHVRFLYGEKVFRFTYPFNGAPAWKTALTPYKGTATTSPFVTLAAR